ncbi:hypothetical protein BJ322DRAFT_1106940 [Thelephora terrestris]|uniref:Uncharacterized protein n=1 Tax=Thelephora terrestris TaxID=56493 RepID=A0A9P6HGK5_9AGAM|nr:hypothetical protein BJ322DRAFT_1106940 [Thelephora terrestris]
MSAQPGDWVVQRSARSQTPAINVSGHSHLPPTPSPTLRNAPGRPTVSTTAALPTSTPTTRSDLSELRLSPPTASLISTISPISPVLELEPRTELSPAHETDGAPRPPHPTLNLAPGRVNSNSPSPELPHPTSVMNPQPYSEASPTPVTPISAGTDTFPLEEESGAPLVTVTTPGPPAMPPRPEGSPNHPIQVINPFPPPSGDLLQYTSPTRQLTSRRAKKAKETETSTSKRTRARPTNSLTARNLYMIEYLKENPDTTTSEFDNVWCALDTKIKETWNKKSKDAKSAAAGALSAT